MELDVRRGTLRNFVGRRVRGAAAAPPAAAPPAARAPAAALPLGGSHYPRLSLGAPQALHRPRILAGSPRGAGQRALGRFSQRSTSIQQRSTDIELHRDPLRNVFPQARTPRSGSPPASSRGAPKSPSKGRSGSDGARARGGASRRGSRQRRRWFHQAASVSAGCRGCRFPPRRPHRATLAPYNQPAPAPAPASRRSADLLAAVGTVGNRRSSTGPGCIITTDRRRAWTPLAASLG